MAQNLIMLVYLCLIFIPLSYSQPYINDSQVPVSPSYISPLHLAITATHSLASGYSRLKNQPSLVAASSGHVNQATPLVERSFSKTTVDKRNTEDIKTSATLIHNGSTSALHLSKTHVLQLSSQHSDSIMSSKPSTTSSIPRVIVQSQGSLATRNRITSKILSTRTLVETSSTSQLVLVNSVNNSHSSKPFTTSRTSNNSPDIKLTLSQSMRGSTPILAMQSTSSPVPKLPSSSHMLNIFSTPKVVENRTTTVINPSPTLILSSQTGSPVMLNATSTLRTSNQSVTPKPTSRPVTRNLTSSYGMPTHTIVQSLNVSQFVMPNVSSTQAILNSRSVLHSLSVSPVIPDVTSSPVLVNTTSTHGSILHTLSLSPVIPDVTSSPILVNETSTHVVLQSSFPSARNISSTKALLTTSMPTLFVSSVVTPNPSSLNVSPTSAHLNLSSQSTNVVSNKLSSFVQSTSSFIRTSVHMQPTPAPDTKEKTRTALIVGLAVGLSIAMIIVIVIVVYYKRKRSSYHYNVFYDEQNIVMHPFDYSK